MTFAKASHSCAGFFSALVLGCGLLLVETGLSGSVAQAQSEAAAPVATIGAREIRQDEIDAFLANLQRQSG